MGERAIYDSHVHTRNSFDGRDSVGAICEAAIRAGLAGIAFTDHCDMHLGARACLAVKEALWEEVLRAQETFGPSLEIAMGLEIGEPHHDMASARELAGGPEMDFVIGSVHRVRGEDDFYVMDYDRPDIMDVLRKYYEELIELSACDCFDVMGHINYPLRSMSDAQKARIDLSAFNELLCEALSSLARHGKGIEANSRCLKGGLGGILPSLEIMKMFKAAGGEIVTTGSDAHEAPSVGAGIPEAGALLKEAGFEEISFFKGRRPAQLSTRIAAAPSRRPSIPLPRPPERRVNTVRG